MTKTKKEFYKRLYHILLQMPVSDKFFIYSLNVGTTAQILEVYNKAFNERKNIKEITGNLTYLHTAGYVGFKKRKGKDTLWWPARNNINDLV